MFEPHRRSQTTAVAAERDGPRSTVYARDRRWSGVQSGREAFASTPVARGRGATSERVLPCRNTFSHSSLWVSCLCSCLSSIAPPAPSLARLPPAARSLRLPWLTFSFSCKGRRLRSRIQGSASSAAERDGDGPVRVRLLSAGSSDDSSPSTMLAHISFVFVLPSSFSEFFALNSPHLPCCFPSSLSSPSSTQTAPSLGFVAAFLVRAHVCPPSPHMPSRLHC